MTFIRTKQDYHNRKLIGFHKSEFLKIIRKEVKFHVNYSILNHYHPYADDLSDQLVKKSLKGLLDHTFVRALDNKGTGSFQKQYRPNTEDATLNIETPYPDEKLDFSESGAYSAYNWELFFHAPLAIAVHLSRSQRFAEAQKWFHFIFDPTSREAGDSPVRFWRFSQFRKETSIPRINDLLRELENPELTDLKEKMLTGIQEWRRKPFQPHVIARTRFMAYQYNVIMKYLDNLIAWGDYYFRQDTGESIDEALVLYRIAESILGPRPQRVPRIEAPRAKTYAQLKAGGAIDAFGNKLVDLETELPFNYLGARLDQVDTTSTYSMLGIAKAFYFAIPQNENLVRYWDTVQDRLNKIHNCRNIEGMVRQLALFDPPIDPGMLVKAAARGLDMASVISGLNQPVSLMRSSLLIQKALEICSEVKALGSQLLTAIEKKEAEEFALLRQDHELKILNLVEDVRFLQWKEAEESTNSLIRSRETVLQRFRHYQMLLGNTADAFNELKALSIQRKPVTAENFDEVYSEFVEKYAGRIKLHEYPKEKMDLVDMAADTAASLLNLKSDPNLNLNKRENIELNVFMPVAHMLQQGSAVYDVAAGLLSLIPQFNAHGTPLGVGAAVGFGGRELSAFAATGARVARIFADSYSYQGNRAAKTAGYQRRMEEWVMQNNIAANELMHIGRQLIASLIREQITKKEYENHKVQIAQAEGVVAFLQEKFTNKELYSWMQSETQKVYFDCYKFAFDIARKAEQTMKHELMREELENREFISFGYWDSGRKGLLAGEKLQLDIRRMELASHEYNFREYEKVKHISLQNLDPKALLKLKFEKSCEFEIPEWLFDLDGPGEYMRRIKTVSITIPCITGPFTSVSCKASLLRSTIRKLASVGEGYTRTEEDLRFRDFTGSVQTIVTSGAQNDSGLFEVSLNGQQYLPFEGKGVIGKWRLELPGHEQFDYESLSDVVLHIRYTAREGGEELKEAANASVNELLKNEEAPLLFRAYSIRHEFPHEWYRYQSDKTAGIQLTLESSHFPYLHNNKIKLQEKRAVADVIDDQEEGLSWRTVKNETDKLPLNMTVMGVNNEAEDVYLMVSYTLNV